MLKFISFGSGSSGNCYYIFSETCGILLDAGISARKLKKYFDDYGLRLSDIKYILVTHDHADHVKSVGYISNKYKIPVFATKKVHEGIKKNYCVHNKIDTGNIRTLDKNETLQLGDMTITPFHVPHDSCENIGFKITDGSLMFCLMTDIGHITEEMKNIITEADYLVIEANHDEVMLENGPYPDFLKNRVAGENGHLSNNNCAKALVENATAHLKHIWLCHLSQENNHPELALKTVEAELWKSDKINKDVLKIDVLKRNSPSNIFTLK
ncbi:MAG: MBL fold metallo-hydrolase [Prevotella sp.]|nr:MBL fold metallo-hydrolase [Prevotella sp.]